jgi:ribosomal-protein-alanine N-acetyltransferase
MQIITQTPRLIIREFSPGEEPLFLKLMTDTRVTDYLPPRNAGEISILFKETLDDYTAGIKLSRWGIFSNDESFIGMCLLKYIIDEPRKAELGYVIHDAYKGKGIATELSNALLVYGFEKIQLTTVFAVTDQDNIASQIVLKKAGLKQGDNLVRNGKELAYFALNADEWVK